jgi:hypothetical protein
MQSLFSYIGLHRVQNGDSSMHGSTSSAQPPSPRQAESPAEPPGGGPVIRPPKPAKLALPPKALPAAPALSPVPAAPESLRAPALAGCPASTSGSFGKRSNVSLPQPAATPSAQKTTANATVRTELEGERRISPEHTTFFAHFRRSACSFKGQVLSSPRCLAARDFVLIRSYASSPRVPAERQRARRASARLCSAFPATRS